MKKILFLTTAAIAALTLAGCQKTESAMGLGGNDAIGFAPYIGRSITKSAVTDVTADNLTSFNAMCYLTGSADKYFKSEQAVTKNASGYWGTVDTYLWPESAKLDFFAYAGSGSSAVSNTGGVAKVSYTVPDNADEDFIVAYSLNHGKPSSSPYTQSLSFSHALAKLSRLTLVPRTADVSAESADRRFVVTDVRIVGAKTEADYTFNPSSGSNWGTASGDKDYVFSDGSFNFACNSSHTFGTGTSPKVNDQLVILPQTVTFSVTYSVESTSDGGTTWTTLLSSSTKTADIELEMGKAYAINLQIPFDAAPIAFSLSVSGWGDEEEVDTTVKYPHLLSSEFSVSASKKVFFTNGNLYWDGSEFHIEDSQAAYPSSWNTSHVGHFYWTKTAAASYAASYSDGTCTASDVPFFAESTGGLSVDGMNGLYTLSSAEWSYLLSTRRVNDGTGEGKSYQRATVKSVYGLIIYPDGYSAQTSSTSYDSDAWETMENAGCVFLPAAGYSPNHSGVCYIGFAYYWASNPSGTDAAYYLRLDSSKVSVGTDYRISGSCVRLVSSTN